MNFEYFFLLCFIGGKHAEQKKRHVHQENWTKRKSSSILVAGNHWEKTSKSPFYWKETKVPSHNRINSICLQCIRRFKLCFMFSFEIYNWTAFSTAPSKHRSINSYWVWHMSIQWSYLYHLPEPGMPTCYHSTTDSSSLFKYKSNLPNKGSYRNNSKSRTVSMYKRRQILQQRKEYTTRTGWTPNHKHSNTNNHIISQ